MPVADTVNMHVDRQETHHEVDIKRSREAAVEATINTIT
jgi:hypothetical protein